jgi:predicted DCC family thiol-disulfide oxidoreductase YuxK
MVTTATGCIEIIYDGLCPACDAYFRFQRLSENGISTRLIDARQHPNMVDSFARRGINLDRDFVLRFGEAEYVGGEAMFVLASLGTRNSLGREVNARLFRSRRVTLLLYRVLRVGRYALLFLLGRPAIETKNTQP